MEVPQTSPVRSPTYLLPGLLLRRAQVLFRALIESLFATRSAEVILLSLVLRSSGCLFLVHLHLADWVDCHWTPPQFSLERLEMSAIFLFWGIPRFPTILPVEGLQLSFSQPPTTPQLREPLKLGDTPVQIRKEDMSSLYHRGC